MHGVALVGERHQSRTLLPVRLSPVVVVDLDLAVDHGDPGAFVNLVIVEALAGRNQQGDRARIVGARQGSQGSAASGSGS